MYSGGIIQPPGRCNFHLSLKSERVWKHSLNSSWPSLNCSSLEKNPTGLWGKGPDIINRHLSWKALFPWKLRLFGQSSSLVESGTVSFFLLSPGWLPGNSVDFFHCWVDWFTLQQTFLLFLPFSFGCPFWGLTTFFPLIWGSLYDTTLVDLPRSEIILASSL